MQEYERILIVKPSSLGDVIHALPVLKGLRLKYPRAHLAWFVHEKWADILEGDPDLNEVITWSFRWSGLGELFRIFKDKRFDLAIDLQGLLRSAVISYLSGARIRIGFANGREGSPWLYTQRVAVPRQAIHAVDRYLLVAESLGLQATHPSFSIHLSEEDVRKTEDLLRGQGFSASEAFVVINPMARWRTKRWPVERFAQLADRIQTKGIAVLLVGSKAEQEAIEYLKSMMKTVPVSVAGQISLKQLAVLLKKSKLLVCNDSGPMHLAAAVGTPVVAMFGPTDPVRTGPYQHLAAVRHTVVRKGVDCAPCLSRRCRVKDHRCMMQIETEEVFEKIMSVLSEMSAGTAQDRRAHANG